MMHYLNRIENARMYSHERSGGATLDTKLDQMKLDQIRADLRRMAPDYDQGLLERHARQFLKYEQPQEAGAPWAEYGMEAPR